MASRLPSTQSHRQISLSNSFRLQHNLTTTSWRGPVASEPLPFGTEAISSEDITSLMAFEDISCVFVNPFELSTPVWYQALEPKPTQLRKLPSSLLVLLLLVLAAVGVDHTHVQLGGTGQDSLALGAGDGSGDLGSVLAVVQQQQVDVLRVEHAELLEAVGQHVLDARVGSVTDVHMGASALELAAEAAINTTRAPPDVLDALKLVCLPAGEVLGALRDLLLGHNGGRLCHDYRKYPVLNC